MRLPALTRGVNSSTGAAGAASAATASGGSDCSQAHGHFVLGYELCTMEERRLSEIERTAIPSKKRRDPQCKESKVLKSGAKEEEREGTVLREKRERGKGREARVPRIPYLCEQYNEAAAQAWGRVIMCVCYNGRSRRSGRVYSALACLGVVEIGSSA